MTTIDYAEAVRLLQRGRRSERRAAAWWKFITALITSLILNFLYGWFLMLAIGIAHSHWWRAIPTIGYWWAVLLVAITPGVFTAKTSKSKDD